jgi:hypothetical protein
MVCVTDANDTYPLRGDGWQTAATLPGLLDVRVVRAELTRLRGPRPATELYKARASHTTISGEG